MILSLTSLVSFHAASNKRAAQRHKRDRPWRREKSTHRNRAKFKQRDADKSAAASKLDLRPKLTIISLDDVRGTDGKGWLSPQDMVEFFNSYQGFSTTVSIGTKRTTVTVTYVDSDSGRSPKKPIKIVYEGHKHVSAMQPIIQYVNRIIKGDF